MKRKFRVDFVAHYSMEVEVEDTENAELEALYKAENEINDEARYVYWEVEDNGVEEITED